MRTLTPIAQAVTVITLSVSCLCSVSRAETVLVDFGTSLSFRGVTTSSPDANGNHWNVFKPGDYLANMVNTSGSATTIDIGLDATGGPVGTDSYNGPAGATSNPVSSAEVDIADVDSAALGSIGIKEAVIDFVTSASGRFQIQGLDPAKTYRLQLFASHKFSANPTTVFTVFTDSTYTTAVTTASVDVQNAASPWLHNRDTLATFRNLVPQTSNIFYVQFNGLNGTGNGYLNALRITTEIAAPANPSATGATGAVNLSWSASSGATHYSISRAGSAGGPYTVLANTVIGTTYSDTTVAPGLNYYYVVTAADAEIVSGNSNEVFASPLSVLSLIETWRESKFGGAANTGLAADDEDPDSDGVKNLIEYALGGEPMQSGSSPHPVVSGGSPLTIEFSRITDPSLTYTVEASDDLTGGYWNAIWSSTGAQNIAGPVSVSDPGPVGGNKRFLRLSISVQ